MGGRGWTQRSCRTGGGGGVVRRTVGAQPPATEELGASAAPRRTQGFAHVDNKQRADGVLSDSRSSRRYTTKNVNLCSDFWEFKSKRSSGNSTRCFPSEHMKNEKESYHTLPSVMTEPMDFDAPIVAQTASQSTSFSWSRKNRSNKTPSNEKSLHVSSIVSDYELSCQPKFHLHEGNTNVKYPNNSGVGNFRYQLVTSAGRSDSAGMGQASAKCSLSERMSLLRQPRHGHSYENRNRIGAINQRQMIGCSGGVNNMFRKEKVVKQSNSSTGRHQQVLLDNAVVRWNQLCYSQPPNEESSELLWSSTNSESGRIVCFSSSGSSDNLQASLSSDASDTSDNSKLSSPCIADNYQWKLIFKKVRCHVAGRKYSMSATKRKEIEQPSPVSVLEPPAEDFSYGENIKLDRAYHHASKLTLEPIKFPCVEAVAEEVGIDGISDDLCSEMEASQNDEIIQLVEDILEEFVDEEERDFSYLLDILIASGIHGTKEDQLYKVCQSLDCPAGYDVFEKLENKYMRVSQWPRSERKLVFDMVNSILSEILAPCLDMHPWVNTGKNTAPMWGSEGLLEKVLQILAQTREKVALCKPNPVKKAFDQKWPDLADCINKAGRDVEKMITGDLLEELLLELVSS